VFFLNLRTDSSRLLSMAFSPIARHAPNSNTGWPLCSCYSSGYERIVIDASFPTNQGPHLPAQHNAQRQIVSARGDQKTPCSFPSRASTSSRGAYPSRITIVGLAFNALSSLTGSRCVDPRRASCTKTSHSGTMWMSVSLPQERCCPLTLFWT
jgi:hypothetical protein